MDNIIERKKLFAPLKNFDIFDYFTVNTLKTKSGHNIPFVYWPDGTPCHLANLYILELLKRKGRGGRGLSREGDKCGTLGEYIQKCCILLNYCYYRKINLIELTDSAFCDFIFLLRNRQAIRHPDQNETSPDSVISVGKACLEFLMFVGNFHGDANFVAVNGTINIIKNTNASSKRNSISPRGYGLSHAALLLGHREHTRSPITTENIAKLRESAGALTNSKQIKQRRLLFISLLEHTGGRRSEVGAIKVPDIKAAMRMKHPKLRLTTLKQGITTERLIPVTKMVLSDAIKYIDIYRSKIIRKFNMPDHGFLFISDTTGKPLSKSYLTTEMGNLRRHAKIEEQACAHMFRHAFITNQFIRMITQYKIKNRTAFLHELSLEGIFFAEIREITGHKDPWSLVPYIHLAFKHLSGHADTMTSVHLSKVHEVFDQKHEELMQKLEDGMSPAEYRKEYAELVRLRDEDLEIARTREA